MVSVMTITIGVAAIFVFLAFWYLIVRQFKKMQENEPTKQEKRALKYGTHKVS